MSTYIHLYDATTGLFTGASFHTSQTDAAGVAAFIAEITPPGHAAYTGYVVDSLSQKVDVSTGRLVEYQPPQPSAMHEWNPTTRRWQRPAEPKRSSSLSRIAQLEATQHRATRETLIQACRAVDALRVAVASNSKEVRDAVARMHSALARLESIDLEIVASRRDLS